MKKQLVSFGNYLLSKYGVMVYSTDGKNEPLYARLVHDADIVGWEEGVPSDLLRELPSGHQIGDIVTLSFGETSSINGCEIIKVHFADYKVLYDVSVPVKCEGLDHNVHTAYTRLYNVDSAFVTKPSVSL